jgi:hypothetical protein
LIWKSGTVTTYLDAAGVRMIGYAVFISASLSYVYGLGMGAIAAPSS